MKLPILAAITAAGFLLCHCEAGAQTPTGETPAAHATMSAPDKSDSHVAELYNLMKVAHAPNAPPLAHAVLLDKVKAISAAHAKEAGADPAAMEPHLMQVLQNVMMASQKDPHVLDSLDTFDAAMHAAAPAGAAAHH
jgi:hypothetical protein